MIEAIAADEAAAARLARDSLTHVRAWVSRLHTMDPEHILPLPPLMPGQAHDAASAAFASATAPASDDEGDEDVEDTVADALNPVAEAADAAARAPSTPTATSRLADIVRSVVSAAWAGHPLRAAAALVGGLLRLCGAGGVLTAQQTAVLTGLLEAAEVREGRGRRRGRGYTE